MSSRTATKTYSRARDLALTATNLRATAEEALIEKLQPLLGPGETRPNWLVEQDLVIRLIEKLGGNLIEQDDAYARAQLVERQRRELQRAAANRVIVRLVDARNLFRRLYGTGKGLSIAELDANLSRQNPRQLVRIGQQLVETLREPGFAFPAAEPTVVLPDPVAYAAAIADSVDQLAGLLEEEKGGRTGALTLRQQRNVNLTTAREGVRRCYQYLFGLYQLAGMDLQAEKLRPSDRRKKPEGEAPAKSAAEEIAVDEPEAGETPQAPGKRTTRIKRRRRRRGPILPT